MMIRCSTATRLRLIFSVVAPAWGIMMVCELPRTKAQSNNFTLGAVDFICRNDAPVKCDSDVTSAMTLSLGNNNHRNIISFDVDGAYALGFVRKGQNFYLSMYPWYASVRAAGIAVWTAHRFPVDENATLAFLSIGTLELRTSQGYVVWSTNTAKMGVNGLSFLGDVGALLLFDSNNESVWRSLDHPADTLIKGQVLVPGGNPVMTKDDGRGVRYSLAMNETGLVLSAVSANNDSQTYWTAGYQGGNFSASNSCNYSTSLYAEFFPALPPGGDEYAAFLLQTTSNSTSTSNGTSNSTSTSDGNHYFCANENGTEQYGVFRYPRLGVNDSRALMLELNGTLRVYSWPSHTADRPLQRPVIDLFGASNPCQFPNPCGPFGVCNADLGNTSNESLCSCPSGFKPVNSTDFSQGCTRPGPSLSQNNTTCTDFGENSNHSMLDFTGLDYFANDFTMPLSQVPQSDCRQVCLGTCSCLAAFYRVDTGQCFHSHKTLLTLRSANSSFLAFIKVENRPKTISRPWKITPAVVSGVVVATIGVSLIFALTVWQWRRARVLVDRCEDDEFLDSLPGLPPRLTFKELDAATEGFSQKLGAGGFGVVYKGVMADGSTVAVKRLESAAQGMKEFRAEVATIGSIHHINLVRLCAFCVEGPHRLLVYEYMANSSLDCLLFPEEDSLYAAGETVRPWLDWKTRMRIAVQTARGLAYLHEECREKILHLDIKPQNILLDEHLSAKLADFGLSKLVSRDQQSMVVTQMRGTPGYLAPEWLLLSAVTDKADIYSFGIVLLELFTGRKNLDMTVKDPEHRFLPAWAFHKLKTGDTDELFDKRLDGAVPEKEAGLFIKVALWCIQEDPDVRPSIGAVLQMFEGFVTTIPEPPLPLHFSRRMTFAGGCTPSSSDFLLPDKISPSDHPPSGSDFLLQRAEGFTDNSTSYKYSQSDFLPR